MRKTLVTGYLFGLLSDPEDDGCMFLRNVGKLLIGLHNRRQYVFMLNIKSTVFRISFRFNFIHNYNSVNILMPLNVIPWDSRVFRILQVMSI
jgi:hypothetical protein